MHTDGTRVLAALCEPQHSSAAVVNALNEVDRNTVELFREEAALRLTITRALLFDPDDVAGREPLFMRLHALQRATAGVEDRIAAAVALIDNPPADEPIVKSWCRRGPNGWEPVESWRFPYLAADLPNDGLVSEAASRALALAS